MSRNAAAYELMELIRQINSLAERGERLSQASGGLVDPHRFAGVRSCMTLACGDLDQQGMLVNPASTSAEGGP